MIFSAIQLQQLPLWTEKADPADWLVKPVKSSAQVVRGAEEGTLVISNGLIARKFRLAPNAATIGFSHLQTGENFLRAVKPEASITLDGTEYAIGGLVGQPNLAFLTPEWIGELKNDPKAFQFSGFEVGKPTSRIQWKRVRHSENRPWPPKGVALKLHFAAPKGSAHEGVRATVNYELYDGIPVLCKWIEVQNPMQKSVQLNRFKSEILGVAERESTVDVTDTNLLPRLSVFSEYAFGGINNSIHCRTIYWNEDPGYSTQVNYEKKTPCLLEIRPPIGPDQVLAPGGEFESFRAYELLLDSDERERRTLSARKFYRTLAPWTTENPIMLHLATSDPVKVYPAIDQAAECGFEMIVISFWSGLDMEDLSAANVKRFKEYRDYAAKKGLELGGYSLLASRRIDDTNDVINPKTGKTGGSIFGNSPCLCSKWGSEYFQKVRSFLEQTGFNLLEHDGNYPGDLCASSTHPGHNGLEDSQWNQWLAIRSLYETCREKGIYLNVPDWYFLAGSNKTGMGYRESNWSLPRAQQHIHARQNLFDGTWDKAPSMGWMMTPLVEYQGGGAAATIEPLKDHLVDYEQHLYNCFGYGAQSCYRGTRLYDAPETKTLVVNAVNWFKKYRDILESDVIHIKRADGSQLDAILHANSSLKTPGLLMVFNPSDKVMEQEITVPLYYTGIEGKAVVSEGDAKPKNLMVSRDYSVRMKVKVPPTSRVWYTIRKG